MKKIRIKKTLKIVMIEAVIFVLLVGGLFFFTPKITGVAGKNRVTFFEFTNAYAILVDDNPDFSSPEKITNKATRLKPGEYYWRAVGILGESETGNFTIDSEVSMSMNVKNETTILTNIGNVASEVTSKTRGIITGKMIIGINEQQEFENENSTFEVRQNE